MSFIVSINAYETFFKLLYALMLAGFVGGFCILSYIKLNK